MVDLRKEPFMLMLVLMFLLEVDDPRREDLRAGTDGGDLRWWWLLVLLVEEDADARNMLEAVCVSVAYTGSK